LPDHARPNLSWSLRISGVLLLLWLGPVAALLFAFGPDDVFSRIATFFSQMAVVTFGGAYAVLAYVAQEAVETYGWLQPGEMLDGLGMAETTPGPLIMVTQFVGFLAAFREATGLPPLIAATLGRNSHHLGHLPALLPVDLRRRAVHRAAARQPRIVGRAFGDHRRSGGRHSQSGESGSGFTPCSGKSAKCRSRPAAIDLPVLTSVNWPALALAVGAILAMFRFKAGMLPVLGVCSVLGAAYVMII
jgi:chromate transporter